MLIPFRASGWKPCNRNWPIGPSLGTCFVKIWMFPKIVGFPPKSSILIVFSMINHPFWGTPIFGNTHMMMIIAVDVDDEYDFTMKH